MSGTAPASLRGGTGFLPLLDLLRIAASFAIVWHHMRGGSILGGFGLPLFLLVLFGLATSSRRVESLGDFGRRRAARLLVPWMRWSVLYLVLLVAVAGARGLDPRASLGPEMLVIGGHPSLWFLPFAALALVPAKVLQDGADRLPAWSSVALLSGLGVLALLVSSTALTLVTPHSPFGGWMRFAPAIPFGVALGQSRRGRSDTERLWLLALLSCFVLVAFLIATRRFPELDLARRFAVAAPLACLGFGLRLRVPRSVHSLATVTFGVYLVHPLIAKALVQVFDVFAWPALAHTATVWALAAGSVFLLRRLGLQWGEIRAPRRVASVRTRAGEDEEPRRIAA